MITILDGFEENISKGDKVILKIINQKPEYFIDISITEFSKRINAATSTISKFVRHLGFENYRAFASYISKSFYIKENNKIINPKTEETRDIMINKNYAFYAIDNTARLIDNQKTQDFVDCIIASKTVWCIGMGNSYLAARDLSKSLNTQGVISFRTSDIFGEIHRLQQAKKGDLIIIFSERFKQKEYVKLIEMAKNKGVKIAAITSVNAFFIDKQIDYIVNFFAFSRESRPDVVRNTKIQQIFVNNFIISSLIRKNGIDLSKEEKFEW